MKRINRLLTFYIYGNLHIAFMAFLLCYSTFLLSGLAVSIPYLSFIFFSTLMIYCVHRYIGLQRVKDVNQSVRFKKIESVITFYPFLFIIAFLAGLVSLYFLSFTFYFLLTLPCLLSALYVLPVFPKRKRLRDFNFVKIFIIAANWSLLCVFIPTYEIFNSTYLILAVHCFLFFIAITLPFDFRDIEVDKAEKVKTFASVMNRSRLFAATQILLFLSLITGLAFCIISRQVHIITVIFIIEYLIAAFFLKLSYSKVSKEPFLSLYIDGLIGLKAILFVASRTFLG